MALYQLLLIICAAEAVSEMVYVFWMARGDRLELKFSRDLSGTHGKPTAGFEKTSKLGSGLC
jgi:hypothetical protein